MRILEDVLTTLLRSTLLGTGLALTVVVAGCGDGASTRDESLADVYTTVIRWLVDDGVDGPAADQRVFVETIGDEAIPLAVQADVVNRLDDTMSVRFIDAWDEAVDTSEPGDPIRDDGLLIGLGTVADVERSPVRVYADRYRDVRHVAAYELLVERRGGAWRVSGSPKRVAVDEARAVRG